MKTILLFALCIVPFVTYANMHGIYVVKGLKANNPDITVCASGAGTQGDSCRKVSTNKLLRTPTKVIIKDLNKT